MRKKRILLWTIGALTVLGIASGSFALYGKMQMDKIPALSAAEALNYTLQGNGQAMITVGIIENGETSYTVYGKDGERITNTLYRYEIGSLTKTFTAALVCRAAEEGKISLDASISEYLELPEQAHYPTIEELLTHTSGYKGYYLESPMIGNFFCGRNDFYGIDDSRVRKRLGKEKIKEGQHDFCYSNFGYATLGLILEEVYETEYADLVNTYVQEELGLAHTHISEGSEELENAWDWQAGDTYMAAGALTSDVEDMLQYVSLLLQDGICGGEVITPLKEINATTEDYEKLGLRMDEIAYGWILDTQSNIIWHNGGTGDYNCYVGFDKEKQIGVVVLSNLAPDERIPATVIGRKLLEERKSDEQNDNSLSDK